MVKSKEIKIPKKVVMGVFVLILLVGAIMWSSFNRTVESNVVAKVNGEEITSDQVELIQQSFLQQGQQISEEDATEQAINQELLFQQSEQEGNSVTDEETESLIESQLTQQGTTLEEYKQQLESQGVSYENELENIKEQIEVENYLNSVFEEENLDVTKDEATGFYKVYNEQSPEELPPYEEVEPQIISILEQEKQRDIIESLIQELRESADIEYL